MAITAAHVSRGLKPGANFWSQGRTKNFAQIILRKLDAPGIRGLAVRHTGNGRGDAGGDTTGATACTTFHGLRPG